MGESTTATLVLRQRNKQKSKSVIRQPSQRVSSQESPVSRSPSRRKSNVSRGSSEREKVLASRKNLVSQTSNESHNSKPTRHRQRSKPKGTDRTDKQGNRGDGCDDILEVTGKRAETILKRQKLPKSHKSKVNTRLNSDLQDLDQRASKHNNGRSRGLVKQLTINRGVANRDEKLP